MIREPNDTKRDWAFVLAFAVAVVVAIALVRGCKRETSAPARGDIERIDTTVSYVLVPPPPPDTVYVRGRVRIVERWRDSMVVLRDTVNFDTLTRTADGRILTSPFVADASTITRKGDTTSVRYEFPANKFHFMTAYAPDTQKVNTVTITVMVDPPWWQTALTHIGAAAVGYGIGRAR